MKNLILGLLLAFSATTALAQTATPQFKSPVSEQSGMYGASYAHQWVAAATPVPYGGTNFEVAVGGQIAGGRMIPEGSVFVIGGFTYPDGRHFIFQTGFEPTTDYNRVFPAAFGELVKINGVIQPRVLGTANIVFDPLGKGSGGTVQINIVTDEPISIYGYPANRYNNIRLNRTVENTPILACTTEGSTSTVCAP